MRILTSFSFFWHLVRSKIGQKPITNSSWLNRRFWELVLIGQTDGWGPITQLSTETTSEISLDGGYGNLKFFCGMRGVKTFATARMRNNRVLDQPPQPAQEAIGLTLPSEKRNCRYLRCPFADSFGVTSRPRRIGTVYITGQQKRPHCARL